MFECWTREAPFQHPGAPRQINVREHIMQGGRPVCPMSVGEPPAEYCELMQRCWKEDAGDRPTLEEVAGLLESVAIAVTAKATTSTEAASRSEESGRGGWFKYHTGHRSERESHLGEALLPLTSSPGSNPGPH
mmetsp:Transcript_11439/g.26630  ORF Transcript_11439/g.26630 Transcript_11439/m.26630 type:complete len:133 (-) Transcript_11439:241-639(-)